MQCVALSGQLMAVDKGQITPKQKEPSVEMQLLWAEGCCSAK